MKIDKIDDLMEFVGLRSVKNTEEFSSFKPVGLKNGALSS